MRGASSSKLSTSNSQLATRSALFFHQGEEISFAVAKESHPQLMVRHPGDKMRITFELHTAGNQSVVRVLNAGHPEVKDRAGMVELGLLRRAHHQADAAAVEEGHLGRSLKEQLHAEDVAIEGHGAVEITRIGGDL